MSRITLFGFYNYDPTLFDGIRLPAGCDPQILKDTIIAECGDLYPYYQHPGYLKLNIASWFRRMLPQFERAYNAITVDYAPNENYDRFEDWADESENSAANSRVRNDTNSDSTTTEASNENETGTTSEASGSREDKVSPFDSTTYTPKALTESGNKDESTTTGKATTKEESSTNGSLSSTESGSSTGKESGSHKGRIHGNIGVTTNATLIREELELRRYDFYLDIARQFQKRFIVEVY